MIIQSVKKSLIFFLPILLLISCGVESGKQIVFNAEKSLHKAEQLFNKASIKPDLNDFETWSNVKDGYLSTIVYSLTHLDSIKSDSFPVEHKDLESIAFMATSRLSSIYYAEAKFDSSIILLRQLLSLTKLSGRALLSTQSNLAQTYHASGNWQSGIDVYNSMIDTFYPPIDAENNIIWEILNLPGELHNINLKLKNISNTFEASKPSRDYYQKLITDWPDTELEKESRRKLAGILAKYKKWDEAIGTIDVIKDSAGLASIPDAIKIAEFLSFGKKDHSAAIEIYQGLLERTDDSATLASIYVKVAIAHFGNESYSECRETLKFVKNNYYNFYMSDPIPQQYIALSFEKQNDWNRAEDEYRWLITNFPGTELAFEAYLTIADHYASVTNTRLTEAWYDKAEEFYNRMRIERKGTFIEASAISYLAEVARRRGDWESAANKLEELFRRYPDKEIGFKGLNNAIEIYRNKLDNPAKADSLQALFPTGT